MKKYISEFIASFSLIFFGTGAAIVDEVTHGSITHTGVALAFGLVVMILIYAFGSISGTHINPAVTIAFAINKSFAWNKVLPYIVSQAAGALAGSLLLKQLFPGSLLLGATLPSGPAMQSFILELILTFFLMLVILRVATGSKEQGMLAGLAIGSVVLLEALFAGPISGASMNPIRSLAPALINQNLSSIWIYVTAPFIGSIAAVGVNRFFEKE